MSSQSSTATEEEEPDQESNSNLPIDDSATEHQVQNGQNEVPHSHEQSDAVANLLGKWGSQLPSGFNLGNSAFSSADARASLLALNQFASGGAGATTGRSSTTAPIGTGSNLQDNQTQMLLQLALAQLTRQQQRQPPPAPPPPPPPPPQPMTSNNWGGLDPVAFLQGVLFAQGLLNPNQLPSFSPRSGQSQTSRPPTQNSALLQQAPLLAATALAFSNPTQWMAAAQNSNNNSNPINHGLPSYATATTDEGSSSLPPTAGAASAAATPGTLPPAASASLRADKPPGVQLPAARKKRKYDHESFPEKLHRLLREASEEGHDDIVRFTPDGGQFEVLHTRNFELEILPRYFRHNKANSFKRMLRMYNFRRVQGTWLQGTFEHPLFHRNFPELCKQMQRNESSGSANSKKKKANDTS